MTPAGSLFWALLPLFTVGLGTPAVLGWAAWRLRARALGAMALVSLAVAAVALVLAGAPTGSVSNTVAGALIAVVLVGGGLAVTFSVRGRLVGPPRTDLAEPSEPGEQPGDPAVAEALARRERRTQARQLLEQDPGLARELRVGRPDLPRRYDDGGLADVNHVPVAVLAGLPGVDGELAQRILAARSERGGFDSLAELEVYADLPSELAQELAERLVFVR